MIRTRPIPEPPKPPPVVLVVHDVYLGFDNEQEPDDGEMGS